MSQVLAFDFGASGGRAILAKYDAASGSLKYEEIHRVENGPMDCGGKLCCITQALSVGSYCAVFT